MMLMRRFNLRSDYSSRALPLTKSTSRTMKLMKIQKSSLTRLGKEYDRTGQGRVGVQTLPLLTNISN